MKRRDFIFGASVIASGVPIGSMAQTRPCTPATLNIEGGVNATTVCTNATAESDWLYRTGQAGTNPNASGVVWFHDFRSDAEVDAFRWSPGFSGGNDPAARGTNAGWCRRITTDGITGGGCLEVFRAAGTGEGAYWWRPFSPLKGSGNGRGVDDPGAGGSIAAQAYTAGPDAINGWGSKGLYGHSSYHGSGSWDGTEYYLQMRVKMDPRRKLSPGVMGGKLTYQTHTYRSNTHQEIVTYSYGGNFGVENYFRMYRGYGYLALEEIDENRAYQPQVGSALGACHLNNNRAPCWYWSGDWDTVMYHVVPGRAGSRETLMEVYVARRGQTTYTKIWSQLYTNFYEWNMGYNALICASYQNSLPIVSDFYHRYDQLIFSKSFIPCPLV